MTRKLPMGLGFAAFSFLILGCTGQEKSTATANSVEPVSAPITAAAPAPTAEEEAAALTSTAKLAPYQKEGVKGFLIESLQKDSAWSLAGLREGDIITKVGGKPATGENEMVALLRAMEMSPTPKLDVLRDGKTVKIRPKITQK